MPTLKKSELKLICILAGVIVLIANVAAWKYILSNRTRVLLERKTIQLKLEQAKIITQDKDIWLKRNDWFDSHQPTFASDASGKLFEDLQKSLKDTSLATTRQQILEPNQSSDSAEISTQFTIEGDLEPLLKWTSTIPSPETFRYLKRFSLKLNEKTDKMVADLIIASKGKPETASPVKKP